MNENAESNPFSAFLDYERGDLGMLIDFEKKENTVLSHFWGGDGELIAKMFQDEQNKILKGTLAPGSNIGMHCHETSSEIIFVISGEGNVLFEDTKETLKAGSCHYCPHGCSHSLRNDGTEDLIFYAVVPQHS